MLISPGQDLDMAEALSSTQSGRFTKIATSLLSKTTSPRPWTTTTLVDISDLWWATERAVYVILEQPDESHVFLGTNTDCELVPLFT